MKTLQDCRNVMWQGNLNEAARLFIGSIISDKSYVQKEKKLFYNDIDKVSNNNIRVIDDSFYKRYKPKIFEKIEIKTKGGLLGEFFGNEKFILELPVCLSNKKINVTQGLLVHFISELAKSRVIDDITFNILRSLFNMVGVYYDKENKYIGFGVNKNKNYIFENGSRVNFDVAMITLEEVLRIEVEQGFVSKDVGDSARNFGYTHLLRQHAKFRLTNWFKNVLINWGKYNVVAASRANGKTFNASFIVGRGLFDPRPGFGGRAYREIKYFVPDKENVGGQVMDYIKSFLGPLLFEKLPNGEKLFTVGKYSIKCNLTGNVFKIVSLYNFGSTKELGTAVGEGLACDTAIIDEAARIPNDFWTSFHQRAAFETQEFFIISTINEETPVDHWFYSLLVDGEVGAKGIKSYRITIEDNEIMSFNRTPEEFAEIIATIKKDLKLKGEKEFYAKGYCIILEESNVFNVGSSLVSPNENKYSNDDPRILGFDLGKLDDNAGFTILNLKHREFEKADKVINATYGNQLQRAKEFKLLYPNLLVVGDRSGVGESVSEQDTEGIVDVWIKSTGSGGLSYNKQGKYYTCSKGLIITTLATLFNNSIIKIPYNLEEFIKQLNSFVKMKSGRGETILYKGKGKKKDDLVLSAAYAAVYTSLILGLKTKEDFELYTNNIGDNQVYLYNNENDNNNVNYNYYGSLY